MEPKNSNKIEVKGTQDLTGLEATRSANPPVSAAIADMLRFATSPKQHAEIEAKVVEAQRGEMLRFAVTPGQQAEIKAKMVEAKVKE